LFETFDRPVEVCVAKFVDVDLKQFSESDFAGDRVCCTEKRALIKRLECRFAGTGMESEVCGIAPVEVDDVIDAR
jgi:hypothetical protein